VGKRQRMTSSSLGTRVAQLHPHLRAHTGTSAVPALEAGPSSTSRSIGDTLPTWHPAAIYWVGLLACYLVLAAVTTAVGLAVTAWIVPLDGLESFDASPVQWMAERRTSSLDALSFVGSEISGGVVIPALVAVVVIVSALRRRWLLAGFVLGAILLESATYRTTVFFVDRERPDVERLEALPVDASFPSGHVAASIAVYSGFALLLTSRMTSTRAKALVWAAALAIPPIVAVSRMYRGMHHPLDTLAGVIMGIAALTLAVVLARATGVVARKREARAA
jgi:membrane-associated phospholipid phosphatase